MTPNTTAQPTTENRTPSFLHISDKYVLGTPQGIAQSSKTFDMPFYDFAKDADLQEKLGLLSYVLKKPVFPPPLSRPLYGQELHSGVAGFIAAFSEEETVRQQRREYMMNNGLVRILVADRQLREELKDRFIH